MTIPRNIKQGMDASEINKIETKIEKESTRTDVGSIALETYNEIKNK